MNNKDGADFIEWSTYPLDSGRLFLLRRFRRQLAPLMSNRALRVCLAACFAIPIIFTISYTLPLWQLLLGPIILGIPHLVADLRYLVIHQNLHQKMWFWLGLVPFFILYAVFLEPHYAMIAVLLGAFFGAHPRRPLMIALSVCGLGLSLWKPFLFLFTILHVHNLVALWLWWHWRTRALWEAIPLFLCLTLLVLLFLIPPAPDVFLWAPPQLDHHYFVTSLVPQILNEYADGLILSYAFLQSVHYLVWLRLIPEDARAQPSPRTFNKSLQYLKKDFGSLLFYSFLIGMVMLMAYACFDPKQARINYLTLISFHAFLELSFICYNKRKA